MLGPKETDTDRKLQKSA